MRNFKFFGLIALVLFSFSATSAFAAIDIAIKAGDTVGLNANTEIAVHFSGDDTVGSISLGINFDNSKIQLVEAAANVSGITVPGATAITNANTNGTFNIGYASLDGFTPGADTKIATITCKGTALGDAAFSIAAGAQVTNTAFPPADVTGSFTNKTITVVEFGDPTQFVIVDPTDGTVDAAVTVTIQLQDQDGNRVASDNTSQVTISVDGNAAIDGGTSKEVTMTNGQATVSVTDQVPETVNLSLTDSAGTGYAVASTQDLVFGAGAAAAAQCTLTTLNPATIESGATATSTITFKDQYGNNTTDLGGQTLAAAGNSLTGAMWAATDNTDGTGTATYTASAAGSENALQVTLGGVQIGSDQTVTVAAGPADAAQSTITTLSPATISADETATATITFKDQAGNPTTNLNSQALAAAGEALNNASWAVVDQEDGTAIATYTPSTSGTENALQITLGGTQIGTDQSVTVNPGAAVADQSTLTALNPADITADDTATATVTFKDQHGNTTTDLGGKTLAAGGETLADATWAVADNGDGTGTATYTPHTAGTESALQVTLEGQQIGTDQSVTVSAGAAADFELTVGKHKLASQGKGTTTVTATVNDAKGNKVATDTGRAFTFSITTAGTYLNVDTANVNSDAGEAETTVTTQGDAVPAPPTVTTETVRAESDLGTKTIDVEIVNFSINVDSPAAPFYSPTTGVHLLTSNSTPSTAVFSGLGSTEDDYRWNLDSEGQVPGQTGATYNYTAPDPESFTGDTTQDTLRLSSAADENLEDAVNITVYRPVSITSPSTDIGLAVGDTETTVTASGGTGTYKFQSTNAAAGSVNADSGAVTANAVGTFKVQVRDADYGAFDTTNGFLAESADIEVINPVVIGSTPNKDSLQSGDQHPFTATGGKTGTDFIWMVEGEGKGSIDAEGKYTAPDVETATEVTVIAADATYGTVQGTYKFTVYDTIAIESKPDEAPMLQQGFQSAEYTVSGGDGTYTWTVTDSGNNVVDTATGESYKFTIPMGAGNAGEYTVSVSDGKDFTDSFTVKVPIDIDNDRRITALTAKKLDDTANALAFTVTGAAAASDYTWEILAKESDTDAVGTPGDYGTWAKANPVVGDGTNTFTPNADITDVMKFYLRVTVTNDPDLTEANGLNQRVVGPFTLIPVDTYTVTVLDSAGNGIAGATVTVDYTDPNTDTAVPGAPTDANGDATFILPDAGQTYDYTTTKANYVEQKISSSAKSVEVTMPASAFTIKGTVQDTSGTALAGAVVEAFQPDNTDVKYTATSAADGTYTIHMPADALTNGYTVRAKKTGYIPEAIEDVAAGELNADFLGAANGLQPQTLFKSITAEAVNGKVEVVVIAEDNGISNSFSAATELKAAKKSTTGTGDVDPATFTFDNTQKAISFEYTNDENFVLEICADTSGDKDPDSTAGDLYAECTTFLYEATPEETAGEVAKSTQQTIDTVGGKVTLITDEEPNVPEQTVTAEIVDTGDITQKVNIVIKARRIRSDFSVSGVRASREFVYEVFVTDATGARVPDFVKRMRIRLPFDLSVVNEGDFESGLIKVMHSKTQQDLQKGLGDVVSSFQIDFVGDGTYGYVIIDVNSLSFFGVGQSAGGGGPTGPSLTDGSSDNCFIGTVLDHSGSHHAIGMIFGLVLLAGAVLKMKRKPQKSSE